MELYKINVLYFSSASSWLKVAPFGIRRLLNWLSKTYGQNLPIYITENGFSDFHGNLDDLHRVYYLKHYINQLLKGNPSRFFARLFERFVQGAKNSEKKLNVHGLIIDTQE